MRALINQRGVTIIELLCCSILITTVFITLSLAFPKASQSTVQNRERAIASDLANSLTQKLAGQPYPLVDVTALSPAVNPTCDCSIQDPSALPVTPQQVTSLTFQVYSCVNFLKEVPPNQWVAQCPSSGDTGYKSVFVRVNWTVGQKTYSTTQQAFLARS